MLPSLNLNVLIDQLRVPYKVSDFYVIPEIEHTNTHVLSVAGAAVLWFLMKDVMKES